MTTRSSDSGVASKPEDGVDDSITGGNDAPVTEKAAADLNEDDDRGAFDDKPASIIAVVMLALSLAVFLSALDTTIVTTALPRIAEHFGSAEGYTWIGSAYLLGNAASTPLWGKLSDIFGRKPVLLVANAVFLVGSLIAALSVSIAMLIAARAIQGIGGAGLLVLVDIAISDLFSLRTRGGYLGIIGGVWAIACAVGPIIGGAFTARVSWRWCFYINLPLDGLAFLIILFFLDLKTPKVPVIEGLMAIDWFGTLFVVGGTLMFLIGLQFGGITHPWSSAVVICLIVFGVVCMGIFAIVEWKVARYPLIQLSIFSSRSNIGCYLFTFLHGIVFIAEFYYLPLYFQAVRGASPLLSGVYVLPSVLGTGLAATVTGIYIGSAGKYLPPIYAGAVMMLLGYGLLIDFDAHSGWAKLIIFQIIAGIGVGPNFQAPLVALQTGINPRDIATATATFNFLRQLANAISVVVGQVVFQNQMAKKHALLVSSLGPQLAVQLGGSGAAANSHLIDQLPGPQKEVARTAFADSLRPMWIMYTAFSALALLSVFLIGNVKLSSEHKVQEVGLEAEKKHAADRKAEKALRDAERQR